MSDLPIGWAKTTLGAIQIDSSTGINPAHFPSEEFELFSVPSHPTGAAEILRGSQIGSNKQTVVPNTVLLCKINPRINRVWVVEPKTDLRTIASTEWIPFGPREEIRTHYLAYYLQQSIVRDFLAQHASGVGGSLMRVKPSTFADFQFNLAPRNEQDRIVAEIEKQFTRLDAATAALKRVQANLKRYRASVLKAACEGRLVPTEAELARKEGREYEPADNLLQRILRERRARCEADTLAKMIASGKRPTDDRWKQKYKEPPAPDAADLTELPEGWCWASLGQLTDIQGGIQKQPSRIPRNNSYPFLRVANVLRGQLDLQEIHQIELFEGELERLRLKKGDLLVVEGNGSPSEIGRMAAWSGEIQNCVHQNHIIRARPLPGTSSKYLMHFWNSPAGASQVLNVASSTSGLHTLSVGKISRLAVPLPPEAEQERIAETVDELLLVLARTQEATKTQNERTASVRQSILRNAFTGQLVPQDPTDEPASVLLERIRAARVESSKKSASRKVARKRGMR